MGAHDYIDVEYGMCVLTKDSIIPLSSHVLSYYGDSLDGETYMNLRQLNDSIFSTVCFNADVVKELKRLSVQKKYDFSECNVSPFNKDLVIPLSVFEESKQVDMQKTPLFALDETKGYYKDNKEVHILYDFGNVILTQNIREEEESLGATFDYIIPMYGGIEYDYWTITGVLF